MISGPFIRVHPRLGWSIDAATPRLPERLGGPPDDLWVIRVRPIPEVIRPGRTRMVGALARAEILGASGSFFLNASAGKVRLHVLDHIAISQVSFQL